MGLYFLAEKVAALIYNAPGAASAIQTMSIGILFLGLHQISTGVLQGLGKTAIPVINMIIACVVKVVVSWMLTAVPELGIKGASMATVADFAVAAIINMGFIYKFTGFRMSLGSIIRPCISASIMGAAIYGVLVLTSNWGAWSILAAMIISAPTYTLALMASGGLNREDLENIPFLGRKLLGIGQKLGMFKA